MSDHRGNESESGFTDYSEITTPGTNPAAGFLRAYAKSDDNFYKKNNAGVEALVGGAGAATPIVIQSAVGGAVNSQNPTLFTFGSAPISGHAIIVGLNMVGRGATALSSTNTTWTKVDSFVSTAGSHYEIWVGIVSGVGGTAVSMTSASSNYWSVVAVEVTDALTPTKGASQEINLTNSLWLTTAPVAIPKGHLVAFLVGEDNTVQHSVIFPNSPFVANAGDDKHTFGVSLAVAYSGGVAQATVLTLIQAPGANIICEIT